MVALIAPTKISATTKSSRSEDIKILTKHPVDAFTELVSSGNFIGALETLERVKISSGIQQYYAGLAVLTAAGNINAYEKLIDELRGLIAEENPSNKNIETIGHALKTYFINTGKANEGIPVMIKLFEDAREANNFGNETLALLSNIVGMVAWKIDDHDTVFKYEELAVMLNPDEPSYWYNHALTLEKFEKEELLVKCLERLSKCSNLDITHEELLNSHGFSQATTNGSDPTV